MTGECAVGPRSFARTLRDQRRTRMKGGLYHLNQVLMAYNSNRIEGGRLDEEQTRYIYETRTITGENVAVDDVVEAVNSFELFDEVIDRLGEPITAETMKDYHRILKRGTADARRPLFAVGEYKRVPNAVGGRETVAPEHVALAVEDLIARTPARRGRLFGGGFEGVGREGRGGGLLGRVLPVRRVVAKASECVSPLRLDGASRMVGRCLACRDAADSRDRHLTPMPFG